MGAARARRDRVSFPVSAISLRPTISRPFARVRIREALVVRQPLARCASRGRIVMERFLSSLRPADACPSEEKADQRAVSRACIGTMRDRARNPRKGRWDGWQGLALSGALWLRWSLAARHSPLRSSGDRRLPRSIRRRRNPSIPLWSNAAASSRRSATAMIAIPCAGARNFAGGLAGTDAVRHDLLDQHHAGCRRPASAAGRKLLSAAPCGRASIATAGISIRPFRTTTSPTVSDEDDRRALCVSDDAASRSMPRRTANAAAVPVQPAHCRRRLEAPVPPPRTYQPDRPRARNGIAAPIWSKGSPIAAPVIRRAMRSAPKGAMRPSPAARPKAGPPTRSTTQSPAPVPWDADALFAYLRNGWQPDHGAARGPMASGEQPCRRAGRTMSGHRDLYGGRVRRDPPAERQRDRAGDRRAASRAPMPATRANRGRDAAIYAAALRDLP